MLAELLENIKSQKESVGSTAADFRYNIYDITVISLVV